jgi:hypothetical protein
MSTKFIHIRNYQPRHPSETTIELSCKGGTTVAYELDDAGGAGKATVRYAVAHCSPRDNYCRATGRAVASGRLKSAKIPTSWVTVIVNEQGKVNPVVAILRAIGQLPESQPDVS